MKRSKVFKEIRAYINTLPVFSDHEHHQTDAFFAEGMNLDKAITSSYIAWTGHIPDGSTASRQDVLEHTRFNSYFYWFEKGIQRLYGVDEPISLENWDAISAKITQAHLDPGFHWKTLLDHGYERLIIDTYWSPGENNGHPEAFSAAFRIDRFMYGIHPESVTPQDSFCPWQRYGFTGGTLTDYLDLMRKTICDRHAQGIAVCLKCAEAYNRTIDFMPDDVETAQSVFGRHPSKVTPDEIRLFGNFIFHRCCELAAELDIPFQVHTGLAQLSGSNPMNLLPVLIKHSNTRFILFHTGYPWTHEVAGIVHNHMNAYPSLTWTSIICTSAAIRALHDLIDVTPSINTITWGSDCWVPEESIGAMEAWRYVVAHTLADRVVDNRLDMKSAQILARKLMYENGRSVYMP